MGCIKGCLDFLGVDVSMGWLYGATAHAFVLNMNETVNVDGPVANDALVFLLSNGIVTCHDIADGATVWEREFDSDFQSSPTLAGDRLYLLGCEGTMYIVSAGRTFEEIGRAELGEPSSCSPAFVDGRIYIRGEGHLFCIEEE